MNDDRLLCFLLHLRYPWPGKFLEVLVVDGAWYVVQDRMTSHKRYWNNRVRKRFVFRTIVLYGGVVPKWTWYLATIAFVPIYRKVMASDSHSHVHVHDHGHGHSHSHAHQGGDHGQDEHAGDHLKVRHITHAREAVLLFLLIRSTL